MAAKSATVAVEATITPEMAAPALIVAFHGFARRAEKLPLIY